MSSPVKLNTRHRVLMRRLLAGWKLKEACADLGYNLNRASIIVNSPLFKEEMQRMQERLDKAFIEGEKEKLASDVVRNKLERLAEKAVDALEAAVERECGAVRVAAAKEILDRSGYGKTEKREVDFYVQTPDGLVDALKQVEVEQLLHTSTDESESGDGKVKSE